MAARQQEPSLGFAGRRHLRAWQHCAVHGCAFHTCAAAAYQLTSAACYKLTLGALSLQGGALTYASKLTPRCRRPGGGLCGGGQRAGAAVGFHLLGYPVLRGVPAVLPPHLSAADQHAAHVRRRRGAAHGLLWPPQELVPACHLRERQPLQNVDWVITFQQRCRPACRPCPHNVRGRIESVWIIALLVQCVSRIE